MPDITNLDAGRLLSRLCLIAAALSVVAAAGLLLVHAAYFLAHGDVAWWVLGDIFAVSSSPDTGRTLPGFTLAADYVLNQVPAVITLALPIPLLLAALSEQVLAEVLGGCLFVVFVLALLMSKGVF